jgi:uncharacterized membrane protein
MDSRAHAVEAPRPEHDARRGRIAAIDVIRGAVMVVMAIDHVRVYSGLPAGGPTYGIFFTRWITHFCAPAFVLLAGTSAYFYGRKHADLARFLVVRGAWLVVLELTVLRVAWTFNFDFAHYELAGVIWVIGVCMILLAAATRLPAPAVAAIGLAIIAGHNALDGHVGAVLSSLDDGIGAAVWRIVYLGPAGGPVSLGADGPQLAVLYSVVPWIGVMMAGYGLGHVLALAPARRNRICLALGLGAIALFGVLRGCQLYGDPRPWSAAGPQMPALLAFLNTTKYPASLQFLLMTLGPIIAAIPVVDNPALRGRLAGWLAMLGRVPLFYYLLHIPLIHLLALGVSVIRTGGVSPWLFANHPMGNPPPPDGYPWGLPILYLVWLIAIVLLSMACRWFADRKARHADGWLRYL